MLKKDVLAYFDPEKSRVSVTAKALGITPGAVYLWPDNEPIPEPSALKACLLSAGKLEFKAELYIGRGKTKKRGPRRVA